MNKSFAAAKTVLSKVPSLVHPDPAARISVSVDASGSHIGAVYTAKCLQLLGSLILLLQEAVRLRVQILRL